MALPKSSPEKTSVNMPIKKEKFPALPYSNSIYQLSKPIPVKNFRRIAQQHRNRKAEVLSYKKVPPLPRSQPHPLRAVGLGYQKKDEKQDTNELEKEDQDKEKLFQLPQLSYSQKTLFVCSEASKSIKLQQYYKLIGHKNHQHSTTDGFLTARKSEPVLSMADNSSSIRNITGQRISLVSRSSDTSLINRQLTPEHENRLLSTKSYRATILPLSPRETKSQFLSSLSTFELREITNFDKIWFFGVDAKKVEGIAGADNNDGYDDENGSYTKVLHDHIAYRYEILEVIGKGSFGEVVKALDHMTNKLVAIKLIRNKKRFKQQSKIEVSILDELRNIDTNQTANVINMIDHFTFRNHLCIVFELFGINLYESIKANDYQGFKLSTVKRIVFNVLKCLCLTYSQNIIHCDLKPENILIGNKDDSAIRVIDFGSSCRLHERVYTYIQSRFYRSPEVILGMSYGTEIDMWSLGCIIIELVNGSPIFPGENEIEQLACIMEMLGLPPTHMKQCARRWSVYFDLNDEPKCVTNTKGKRRIPKSKDFSSVLKQSDPQMEDFLRNCLMWEPKKRFIPAVAITHDWFKDLKKPSAKKTKDEIAQCLPQICHISDRRGEQNFNVYSSKSGSPESESGYDRDASEPFLPFDRKIQMLISDLKEKHDSFSTEIFHEYTISNVHEKDASQVTNFMNLQLPVGCDASNPWSGDQAHSRRARSADHESVFLTLVIDHDCDQLRDV